MTNKATIKLTSENEVSPGIQQAEAEFQQFGDTVADVNKDAAKESEKAAKDSEKAWGDSLKSMRENLNMVGEFALKVFGGLAVGAGAAVFASEKQTEASGRLEKQVKNSGDVVGYTNEQLAQMSERMADVAGISDQVVTGVQTIVARFDNIRGDTFRDATQAALDMAEALDMEAAGAAEKLGEALQNPVAGLGLLEGEGVAFTTAQAEMVQQMIDANDVLGAQGVILDAVKEKFGGAAAEAGGTFSGMIGRSTDRLVDLAERAGKTLLPFLESLTPILEKTIGLIEVFTGKFEDAGAGMEQTVEQNQTIMSEWFDYVAGGLMGLYEIVKFFFVNFGELATREGKRGQLFFTTMVEDAKHLFGEVLPEFLSWLQRNWREVMTDMANMAKTIFTNILTNAKDFAKALRDLISGKGFNFEFTGLTEGFKSSLKEMPNIAKRELTDAEKRLGGEIDTINKSLEDKWNAALLGIDKDIQAAEQNATRAPESEGGANVRQGAPDRRALGKTPEEKQQEEELKIERGKRETAEKESAEKESGGGKAGGFEGLEALRARIAGATGSPEDKRHGENVKKLDELIEAVDGVAAEIADATPEEKIEAAINNQLLAIEDLENALMKGDAGAAGPLAEAVEGLGMLKNQQTAITEQREAIQVLRNAVAGGHTGVAGELQQQLANLGKITEGIPGGGNEKLTQLVGDMVRMQAEVLAEMRGGEVTQKEMRDATRMLADKMPQLGLQ